MTSVSFYEDEKVQVARFDFHYTFKKQINEMNKEYGGKKPIKDPYKVGTHVYDGITYFAFSDTKENPRVDTIEFIGTNVDIDTILTRFIENDQMTVKIGDLYLFNQYDKSKRPQIIEAMKEIEEKEWAEALLGQTLWAKRYIKRNKCRS